MHSVELRIDQFAQIADAGIEFSLCHQAFENRFLPCDSITSEDAMNPSPSAWASYVVAKQVKVSVCQVCICVFIWSEALSGLQRRSYRMATLPLDSRFSRLDGLIENRGLFLQVGDARPARPVPVLIPLNTGLYLYYECGYKSDEFLSQSLLIQGSISTSDQSRSRSRRRVSIPLNTGLYFYGAPSSQRSTRRLSQSL